MNLENELRTVLRREDPPDGFAERVIRQAGPAAAEFRQPGRRRLGWTWRAVAAAAAMLAMMVSFQYGSMQYRHREQRRAAEEAVQALQIVAEELNMAQNEVLNQ